MDFLIFAGGKGSRLGDSVPKPLVIIKGKPLIGNQIDYVQSFNEVNHIILALGYKSADVIDYVRASYNCMKIFFSIEEYPAGTGGALKRALQKTTTLFTVNATALR